MSPPRPNKKTHRPTIHSAMKTKTSFRLFTLAATTLLAGAATGRAQTILNPSFENPATTSYVDGGGDNWSLTAGTALIQSNSLGRGTTPYGTQFLYLRPASTDAQTVGAFTLGQIYTFTLAVADAQFLPNDSITLSVSGGATASQSYSIPESSSLNFPFVDYTVTFIPLTSTTVTLAVTNTSSYTRERRQHRGGQRAGGGGHAGGARAVHLGGTVPGRRGPGRRDVAPPRVTVCTDSVLSEGRPRG